MKTLPSFFPNGASQRVIGIVGSVLLAFACSMAQAQDQAPAEGDQAPPMSPEQIDSLVAPIALYPDALLAQTLAASTYPLEIMQLDQWMAKNTNLKDKALADAVAKQPWDPSVQSMAAFPDVVKRMAENIQWMTEIGNAFLDQQKDVMDAVQRMRAKAQGTGNLKTGGETKVESKTTSGGQQVVVIEQTNPESVYVPSYDPTVVYGAAPADAPYYPYTYPGYQPGTALAWGTAIAVGGAWANNNNWGSCDWDDANVTINNNNNFNKNTNVNKGNANGNWQHNPQHRGNAPYANKQTAGKYGGTARGESRPNGASAAGGAAARSGGAGAKNVDAGNRGGGGGAGAGGSRDAGGAKATKGGGGAGNVSGGDRSGGGAGANRDAGGAKAAKSGGGANSVGNRSVSSGASGKAMGGPGANGASAKAASSRGGSSMKSGGGGGGGGRGGGGGGGGGGRGGGGGGGGGRRR